MKFTVDENSITFEFVYKEYTISVADYVTNVSPQPGYANVEPEGKISVLVQRYGNDLSSKTVERLADYIGLRINGIVTACNNVIEINLSQSGQFMLHLMNSLDIIIP